MNRIGLLFVPVVAVLYPVLIHYGVELIPSRQLGALVLVLVLLRLVLLGRKDKSKLKPFLPFLLIGVAGAATVMLTDNALILLHIPTLVNIVLAGVFLHSFLRPPTIIEGFARMDFPQLPQNAIRYCRRVTLVWTASFLVCAGICYYLAESGHRQAWMIWSSVGIYGYHAIVFGVEFLIRKRIEPQFIAAMAVEFPEGAEA